jgi:formamidopyrimidine-DNA glycosylase
MPELPEVEITRRGLTPVLCGVALEQVRCNRRTLRFPLPPSFEESISGRLVNSIDRLGKFLIFRLAGGLTWIAHLGMSGRFRVFKKPPSTYEKHDHVVFHTSGGSVVIYHDPRRFGFMDLIDENAVDGHRMLSKLGPDPFSDAFTAGFLAARLSKRKSSIKSAIIDQSVIAGMGNIYGSESLFRSKISPLLSCDSISIDRLQMLRDSARIVFAEAIEAGGSTLRDHRQPDGNLGYFQHQFAVYGRAGLPCDRCNCDHVSTGGIKRIVQNGRATYYCPRQQN